MKIIPITAFIDCVKDNKKYSYTINTNIRSYTDRKDDISEEVERLFPKSDEFKPIKDLSDSYEIVRIIIHGHNVKYYK